MRSISKNTVTQDNALITASYAMGLDEKRLLVAAISKLDPESKAWLQGRAEVEIIVTEWADLYGIKGKDVYERLNEASKRLYDRSVRIYGDSKKGKELRWLAAREYDDKAGRVVLTFPAPILHYLTGMIDEFTSYDLLGVSGLKSIHSVRMYELASQFKGTGWRNLTLEQIKEALNLGDSYNRWVDLKKRVIDRACEEITAKSDLNLEYEMIKRGRNVVAIRLKIEEKDQLNLF